MRTCTQPREKHAKHQQNEMLPKKLQRNCSAKSDAPSSVCELVSCETYCVLSSLTHQPIPVYSAVTINWKDCLVYVRRRFRPNVWCNTSVRVRYDIPPKQERRSLLLGCLSITTLATFWLGSPGTTLAVLLYDQGVALLVEQCAQYFGQTKTCTP